MAELFRGSKRTYSLPSVDLMQLNPTYLGQFSDPALNVPSVNGDLVEIVANRSEIPANRLIEMVRRPEFPRMGDPTMPAGANCWQVYLPSWIRARWPNICIESRLLLILMADEMRRSVEYYEGAIQSLRRPIEVKP